MTRAPCTGESTASITSRADDAAWTVIVMDIHKGAFVRRVPKLKKSYSDFGTGPQSGGLSDTRLRKLEAEGVIRATGLDRYDLVSKAGAA